MIKNLLKQKDIGAWLGGGKSLYGMAMAYQSPINVLMQATILFSTLVLRKEFAWIVGWLNFPMFLLFLLGILLFFMLIAWKFEMPSDIRFGAKQGWKHYNPIRMYLVRIFKFLFKMYRKQLEIERKIDRLLGKEVMPR